MGRHGRQVNFYMLPADQLEFEDWLKTKHDVCFIKGRLKSREVEIVPSLAAQEMSKTPFFDTTYLVREVDSKQIFFRHVWTDNFWTVDTWLSPVVEFWRCYYDGEILRRGSLHYPCTFS